MKNRIIFLLIIFQFFTYTAHAETRPYWVFFTDRGSINIENAVAAKIVSPDEPKNTSRRARIFGRKALIDERDVQVNPEYIAAVAAISERLRTVTRFLNGVSVELDARALETVRVMPFVRNVRPVAVFRRPSEPEPSVLMKPGAEERVEAFSYGNSFEQLNMIGIPQIHGSGYLGSGITIAVLDNGFEHLNHTAFESIKVTHMWDFVESNDDLSGADHGTEVLSILAAMDPGSMIGAAPYATYLLARTELADLLTEVRAEEDYWVAGVEWADSLGADIVSSSLGYTTFDDGSGYTYADLDGDTAVTTIAADAAVAKGIIIVTSVGNEGNSFWYYMTTPADGDSVLAVGSVNHDWIVSAFSSRGPTYDGRIKPDFVALGEHVQIVDTSGQSSYKFGNGTSYAAPAVSGAVALLLEVHPTWDFGKLREELISTAEISGPDSLYGYGIIDAFAASGLEIPPVVISGFKVYDPFPQPITFNETTRRLYFPVNVPVEGKTLTIKIHNFTGENIQTLTSPLSGSGLLRYPGEAPFWDGTNFSGENVAPGVYYYSIGLFGYGIHTGKIMVMQ